MSLLDLNQQWARRQFLASGGAGFAGLAASAVVADEASLSHHAARAKSVIFLFMEGGPSHMDLFDPKPLLNELAGQQLPASFGDVITPMGESRSPLLASRRRWRQHGECGAWVSDWLPETAGCVDDLAILRGCWAEGINHSSGVCQMNTCSLIGGRPSLGSWVSWGLGSSNRNLPSFVVMQDNKSSVVNGPRNWSAGFMPAMYQGVRLQEGAEPFPNLAAPEGTTAGRQLSKLQYLNELNGRFAAENPQQSELEARLASYELAFRMQAHAPEAVAIETESAATQRLYGMDDKETQVFGRMCLLARRLVERGTRFVQLMHAGWDQHNSLTTELYNQCRDTDQPSAALVRDLEQRGLLDETLVIWGGEFGRTPFIQGDINNRPRWGRDHHPYAFTVWLAGGGVREGMSWGASDDLGINVAERGVHVHDLQATILHQLGIDHERLTFRFQGRQFRLTDIFGEVVQGILKNG